jgi:hypothetical protein
MTARLLAAALVAAALGVPVGTASACSPAYDPSCQTGPCADAHGLYDSAHDTVGRGPSWYNLDLGVCGT